MKTAYEQAKAHFLANRNTMSDKDMAQARDTLIEQMAIALTLAV